MARMRTIKPEFWTDSTMVRMSPLARLLYVGMWNFSMCDNGHLEDDSMRLKLQILPVDNCDVDELLEELFKFDRIVRIKAGNGKTYLHIPTLKSQQKGDPRWKSRCEACNGAEAASPEPAETPRSLREAKRASPELTELFPVEEGRGEESRKELSTANAEDDFDHWYSSYPRKEAKGAARKAFKAALKKTDLDTLMGGLTRYAESVQGKDRTFIALPSSWLNAERWEDDYTSGAKPTATTSNYNPANW